MSGLLLANVVGVRTVYSESLDQLDVVHAANQGIFAVTNTTPEVEHANECINCYEEEKELAEFH